MREKKYLGIILKKQPLGEADELITLYTKEQGKVRLLAKSVKSAKSKLQQKLQTLFLIDARVAGGKLPKIIGCETIEVYALLRENLANLKIAFVSLELVLKFSPDSEKNEKLFEILKNFLDFLNKQNNLMVVNLGLAKFKIAILHISGFSVAFPKAIKKEKQLFFSAHAGGFTYDQGRPVSPEVLNLFLYLKGISLQETVFINYSLENMDKLQTAISELIEYQLERRLKSEKYLESQNMVY